MEVKTIKMVRFDKAIAPKYADNGSAGADLFAAERVIVNPHRTVLVNTGLRLEIPEGYAGFVFARSGIASKFHVCLANGVGVIDPSYRGEIKVALYNHGTRPFIVFQGYRIAQLVIMPYAVADFLETDKLSDTVRGTGGFGSTGI